MSDTSYGIGGVFRCCTDALESVAPDKEVNPGDTVKMQLRRGLDARGRRALEHGDSEGGDNGTMTWKPLGWTPKKPGFYWVEYTGYRSRERRLEVWEVDFPPKESHLGYYAPNTLTRVQRSRTEVTHFEINFNHDCQPVRWAGPIPIPADPQPETQ